MSVPPPGGWQDPGVPPNSGQPYGQQFDPSGYGAQQPPPPGWQQGAWPQQPSPPPNKGNSVKWLLIAVAVLLVVGISIGATLIFTRGDGGGGSTPSSGAASDFASAGDTGPVGVITDEPTCSAYVAINNALADAEANGWSAVRATLGPKSDWTVDETTQVTQVTSVLTNAADQMVDLAKRTPHRVVRELYEQFIAYGRAYAGSVSTYEPENNFLADANVNIGSTLLGICNAITYNSTGRSLALAAMAPPIRIDPIADSAVATRFVTENSSTCTDWVQREKKFIAENSAWSGLDANIPASQWSAEQRTIQMEALPILSALSDGMEVAGRKANSQTFEDLSLLAAVYVRAYVAAGEDYVGADSWLSYAGLRLNNAISGACQAVGG